MKIVNMSDATYRAVAELATLPFRWTGARQPDGSWLVPVEDETYDRLQRHRLPGESDDDLLQRLMRAWRGESLN